MLILIFFIVYFWLIVMFCLHALVVNTSEKMFGENFNVLVLYFPVCLVGKCGKILNLARYWKMEIKLLNEIL